MWENLTGNNYNLDLVNINAHTNLAKFYPFLSSKYRAELKKKLSHQSKAITVLQIGNNPKLDIVNINAHTKFGQNLSIFVLKISSGNKKQPDINQGP